MLLGILLFFALGPLGFWLLSNYRHAQAHDEQFRLRYHLSEEQSQQIRQLRAEHLVRARALRDRAEATRAQLASQLGPKSEVSSGLRPLFDQAQSETEACWAEEREHFQRVSQLMTPEAAARYLRTKEGRTQERASLVGDLLPLPR